MKIKALTIIAIFISLNSGINLPNKSEAKESIKKEFNLKQSLKEQKMYQRLPKVIEYLTTRVHKTSYVYSGSTPKGWDCSGMVRWTYKQIGITLPHSATKQAHLGKRVSQPKIGDIVAFAYPGRKDFYHSAIYLGNGLIIDANLEFKTTVIEPLSNFKKSQIRFIRILD